MFKSDPADGTQEQPSSTLYEDVDIGLAQNELESGTGMVAKAIRVTNGNAMGYREDLSFPSPYSLGLDFQATSSTRAGQKGFLVMDDSTISESI